ncbi:MAG: Chromate transporter [Chloroflexi bacterium ADurb.Bin325]|nr:MAG: Chromate transporter [Chloroflexi bacterium ADurb.Bin325]
MAKLQMEAAAGRRGRAEGAAAISLGELLRIWTGIGLQSFGGGTSTLYLIHDVCRWRGWLSEEEFACAWALVQIAPGVNLIKLTALVGHGLRGWPGVVAALAGLLLPSTAITILMTVGLAALREQPAVAAVMRGVIPATIGLSLALGVQMAWPLLRAARNEGRASVVVHVAVMLAALLLLFVAHASPLLVLGLGGIVGLLLGRLASASRARAAHASPGDAT